MTETEAKKRLKDILEGDSLIRLETCLALKLLYKYIASVATPRCLQ